MKAQIFRCVALQRLPSISTLKHGFEIVTSFHPGHSATSNQPQTTTITALALQCRDDKSLDVSKKISAYFLKKTVSLKNGFLTSSLCPKSLYGYSSHVLWGVRSNNTSSLYCLNSVYRKHSVISLIP
jgi:hypothetical protein